MTDDLVEKAFTIALKSSCPELRAETLKLVVGALMRHHKLAGIGDSEGDIDLIHSAECAAHAGGEMVGKQCDCNPEITISSKKMPNAIAE